MTKYKTVKNNLFLKVVSVIIVVLISAYFIGFTIGFIKGLSERYFDFF